MTMVSKELVITFYLYTVPKNGTHPSSRAFLPDNYDAFPGATTHWVRENGLPGARPLLHVMCELCE